MPVRTLPIRLQPYAGEGLDSFLEALASRSHAAWGDLLDTVGLASTHHPRGTEIPGWLVGLAPDQERDLSQATGIDPSALSAMTLLHWMSGSDGSRRPSTPLALVCLSPSRSRFCPKCLEETDGRWQLSWRFRWAFVCPLHECLLADTCPECGRWQRIGPLPRGLIPDRGRCARTALRSHLHRLQRCGADLSDATPLHLPPDHVALRAQLDIHGLLRSYSVCVGVYSDAPVSPSQFVADLSAIAVRVLRYATPDQLSGLIPVDLLQECRDELTTGGPRDQRTTTISTTSAATAVAAAIAMDALREPTVAAVGKQLSWLIAISRGSGSSVTNIGWSRHGSKQLLGAVLSAAAPQLHPSDQLRYRCAASVPEQPRPQVDRYRNVPAALWPSARLRFMHPSIGVEQLGSALSVAVSMVGARMTLAQASSALGSVTNRSSVSRILQALHAGGRWPEMLLALTQLAELLDDGACPIDYRRRRALPFDSFLPAEEWGDICLSGGILAGRAVKVRLVRCWMFEYVTGSPARYAPAAIDTAEFRSKLKAVPLTLPLQVVDRLDQAARQFLDRFGLTGEPLAWQPPDLLFEQCGLQSPRPCMEISDIQTLSRRGGLSLSEVAEMAGVSLHHVRHLLERTSHTTA